MDTLNHWRYFLSLEREVNDSLRYVEYSPAQRSVYSFEFARLLLLSCSELDVVFKVACNLVDPSTEAASIGQYFKCLNAKYDLGCETVRLDRYGHKVAPFAGWDTDTPPPWWTSQNKVKHRRHEHFDHATLGNAVDAMCGLFVANLLVLNECHLLGDVHEVPTLLGRDDEPGRFLLEQGYKVAVR